MSDETVSDVFYIKTSDKTTFAIYDLTLNDDCDIMSFGYNFIESNDIPKEQYEEEVSNIVEKTVTEAIREEIDKAKGSLKNDKH